MLQGRSDLTAGIVDLDSKKNKEDMSQFIEFFSGFMKLIMKADLTVQSLLEAIHFTIFL